jgi:hypothetical protein
MAHVARQVVQPGQPSLISESVHGLRSGSNLDVRGAHSIGGLEAATSRVLCRHLQMQPEFLFEVNVAPSSKKRSGQTLQPLANDAHAVSLPHASPCSSV